MNCHSFINVHDLYAEGRLSPRRARAVAAHLSSCASCRAAASPAPSAAPSARAPEDFKARLRAAARGASVAAPHAPSTGLLLWPREARGIALAAVLLAAVALLAHLSGVPSQSPSAAVAAAEEP
jgi:hypothetical protein